MSDIDLSYLEEVTGGSTEIIQEMLTLFLEDTPNQIASLLEETQNENWDNVKAEAHKLKPTFMYVGMSESHQKLSEVESCARDKVDLDTIPALLKSVESHFVSIKPKIEAKLV